MNPPICQMDGHGACSVVFMCSSVRFRVCVQGRCSRCSNCSTSAFTVCTYACMPRRRHSLPAPGGAWRVLHAAPDQAHDRRRRGGGGEHDPHGATAGLAVGAGAHHGAARAAPHLVPVRLHLPALPQGRYPRMLKRGRCIIIGYPLRHMCSCLINLLIIISKCLLD